MQGRFAVKKVRLLQKITYKQQRRVELRMSLDAHAVEEDGELRKVHAVRDLVEELEHSRLHEWGSFTCSYRY